MCPERPTAPVQLPVARDLHPARSLRHAGIHELYTVIDQTARAEKEATLFSRLFMASLVIVAILVCVNAGVTSALIASYKDTCAPLAPEPPPPPPPPPPRAPLPFAPPAAAHVGPRP